MFGIGLLFRGEQTLGLGNVYVPRKKMMNAANYLSGAASGAAAGASLGPWGAAAGAALGLGATIFGGAQSAKKEKEAEAKEAQAHASNVAYWKRLQNEDYADTAAGQNMIRQAKDYANQNWKKAQGAAAVGGGTDAATAMAKESGNRMVGNTLANIAANDTARKDRAGSGLVNENTNYVNQQARQLRTQGANVASAASSMGNAVGSAISSLSGGTSSAKTSEEAGASSNHTENSTGIYTNKEVNLSLPDIWERKENNNLPGVWNRSV